MTEIRPIKRSVQLQPLSREHHDGLLFSWKLREGLNNNTSIDKLREYTGWYWRHHIRPHFFQEEKILLPFVPESHPLRKQLKEEHDDIKELILSIDKEPDRLDFIHLSNLIDSHIRFEEREFFQYLEQHLSEKSLTDIFEQLEKHPVSDQEEWKDKFWTKSVKQC